MSWKTLSHFTKQKFFFMSSNTAREIFVNEINHAYKFFNIDREWAYASPHECVTGLARTSYDDLELAQSFTQYGVYMRRLLKLGEKTRGLGSYNEWGMIHGNKEMLAKRLAYQVLTLTYMRENATPARVQHWIPLCVLRKFADNEKVAKRNFRIMETRIHHNGDTSTSPIKTNHFAHSFKQYPQGFYEENLEELFSKYESDFSDAINDDMMNLSQINSVLAFVGVQVLRQPNRSKEFSNRYLVELVDNFLNLLDTMPEVYCTVGRSRKRFPLSPYSPQIQVYSKTGIPYMVQVVTPNRALVYGSKPLSNHDADYLVYRARLAILRRARYNNERLFGI